MSMKEHTHTHTHKQLKHYSRCVAEMVALLLHGNYTNVKYTPRHIKLHVYSYNVKLNAS